MRTGTELVSIVALVAAVAAPALAVDAHAAQTITLEESTGETFVALGEPLDIFLADASTILLGSGAAVRIDAYRFNPATGAGSLRVTVLRGAVRVSGGLLNDAAAIDIATPHAALSLEGGAALVIVDERRTRAQLLNGQRLTVTAAGVTRELTRPEFAVSAFGGAPSAPTQLSAEQLAADFAALAEGLGGIGILADDVPLVLAALDTDEVTSRSRDIGSGVAGARTDEGTALAFSFGGTLSGAGSFTLDPGDSSAAVSGGASTGTSYSTGVAAPGFVDKNLSFTEARQDLARSSTEIDQNLPGDSQLLSEKDHHKPKFFENRFFVPRKQGPTTNKLLTDRALTFSFPTESQPASFNSAAGGLTYTYGEGPELSLDSLVVDPEGNVFGDTGAVFGLDAPGKLESGGILDEYYPEDPEPPTNLGILVDDGMSIEIMFVPCCRDELPRHANIAGARISQDEIDRKAPLFDDLPDTVLGSDFDFSFLGADVVGISSGFGDIFGKNPDYSRAREASNFLYLEIETDEGNGKLLFAAGDLDGVDGSSAPGLSVDAFKPIAGLRGEDRSFLREKTWSGVESGSAVSASDLTDGGILVVNPSSPSGDGEDGSLFKSAALHADFGLHQDPEAPRQLSTISATIGQVTYRQTKEGVSIPVFRDNDGDGRAGEFENYHGYLLDLDFDGKLGEDEVVFEPQNVTTIDAITTARTIGSSNDGRGGSVALNGPVMSTAAGGGNPAIPRRMGYLVLENAGAVWDDVRFPENNGSFTLPGGTERPVGSDEATRFAFARLGIGTGTEPLAPVGRGSGARAEGFATGIVEVPDAGGIGIAPFATFSPEANVNIDEIAGDATTLTIRMAGTDGRVRRTFVLGGDGASAYVDPQRYGARSPDGAGATVAAISGNLVAAELADGGFETSAGAPITGDGLDYEHVKWGFFFGDFVAAGPQASHVHLGSFAAGPPIDPADLLAATGTATYAGHALGEVLDAGQRRVSGTFEERFDFGSRTGQTRLDFDRRLYMGGSALQGGTYASGVTAQGGFGGELAGRFTGPMSGGQPGGLVGQFRLTNGIDDPAASYRAVGTFAGEKR